MIAGVSGNLNKHRFHALPETNKYCMTAEIDALPNNEVEILALVEKARADNFEKLSQCMRTFSQCKHSGLSTLHFGDVER